MPVEWIDLSQFTANASDRVDEVSLVTFHFNPCRYSRLAQTYRQWWPTLGPLADSLRCYELVFDDDRPEIANSIVIRGSRSKHLMFQKEALINLALRETPANMKYFAWLDHDMVISDPDWLNRSTDQIDRGCIAVQLGSSVVNLDRHGFTERRWDCAVANHLTTGAGKGNPGAAWIADRAYLDSIDGVYANNVVGGGDQAFFDAMIRRFGSHLGGYPDALRAEAERWIANASRLRGDQSPGCLPSPFYHIYHGPMRNRQYRTRNGILRRSRFDPARDVRIDPATGILEWCSDKTRLHDGVRGYFQRRSDNG